jgi:outer membrane protein assembly factor BamA
MKAGLVHAFCILFCSMCLSGFSFTDSLRTKRKNNIHFQDTTAQVSVNRILIIGNKRTREFIIKRELAIGTGDTLTRYQLNQQIEKEKVKLMNTRLFNTVNCKILDYENGVVDLLWEVSERWYTFPIPIFELADRNFNEWWENYNHDFKRVKYGLNLYQYNVRGRNETLLLNAKFGFTNFLRLNYRIPYLDKKRKQGMIVELNIDERKNLAYQTLNNKLEFASAESTLRLTEYAGITWTYRNSFYHFHGITFDYTTNRVYDSLLLINDRYLGNAGTRKQKFHSLSYQYVYENRDFVSYPLKGSYLRIGLKQRGLFSSDDLVKTEFDFHYSHFTDLGKNWYLSNTAVTHISFQDDIPYANYSALGLFRQFLRGYEVYLIEGPQHVYTKTTLKKRVFSRTYNWENMPLDQFKKFPVNIFLKIYADFGYVWNYAGYENGKLLTDKLLPSSGAGVDIAFAYDATLRLEYSINRLNERGLFIHIRREF